MFDVRIVNVDHYMAAPFRGLDPVYSDFRGSSISQVPVIRIFGSTASGKKTCLHIHGVFPYIYVPFDGESHPSHQGYQLAASLDKALNIALGTANSSRQHIFKVVHVKGVPFYGYHEKSHQFLKIYFYNPLIVKKATDLLQNGAVCNKIFQCHESHLPFILQFFIDYNLHGMSFIQLASVEFRQEPGALHHSDLESNPRPAKTTYCELEVDGLASDILNRKTISDGEVANPGLAGIWSEERLRNDVSQLSQNQSQERYGAKKTLSEVLLRQRLREALEQLSDRISGGSARSVVYPAESTPGEHVHDASLVEGFCNNCTELGLPTLTVNLDDSVIDEQLVLSLSQAPTNSQDHSLLDIMQSLAERGLGSPENEEDWLTCSTQKKGEALLSQSFHCENMEGDSVLGVSPNEVAEDECPQRLSTDETVEKEDCWQDSFWNGLDSNDIPQLDGAPDECDESLEDSGRDTPSIRRLTRRRNQDKTILNSISNNPSRVSSPIVIDSSEDESFSNMDCASMNIFNQERFWCVKKENIDNELKNLMLADTMAPASTLKSVMYDESPDVFTGDTNVCGNVDSTYANVLMHGDPSLTSLAEVTSDDNFISSNLNESNCEFPESEPNDNSKNKLSLEENGLDIPLSSRETCLELGDDSADIVASSEFMFNLDYEYSTFEDQEIIDEENDASSESVTKRKPKKSNKPDRTRLKNHYSQSKIEANLGKRKQDRPNNHNKGKTANCNGKQLKTENVDTENKRRIDENVSKQDDVELNNNEMKSKQDRKKETRINRKSSESMEFEESFKTPQKAIKNSENVEAENKKIKTKSKQMNENRSAKSVDEKSDLELKINRKTPKKTRKCSENVDEAENIESKKICKNMKENRLPKSCDENSVDMEFKISRTAVKKCRKSSKNVEEDGLQSVCPSSSENMESQSMKMKKAGNAGDDHDITDDDHDISDDDYNDVDGDGDDDDDDVDLFRITLKKKREGDFKTQILNQSFLETLTSSAISTEVELESKENGQNDTKEFFPCYFFKSNGVAMKFNFPFKRRILNEKTKKCIEERRKKFAFILIPKVDYRVELSHVEDGYLTTDMIEGYGNHKSNEELSSSVNLSVSDSTYLVSNGSPSPKKRKTSEIINPMKNVDTFSPSPRTSIKYRNEQLSPNRNFCHVLKHSSSRQDSMKLDANNSVCLPEKSKKAKKSLGFGLKSKANGDSAQMYDPLSSKLRFTEQFYSPENKKCSSPIKAKLTQSKASLIKAARKQSNGSDAFELCENDINSPNKIKSPNASTNWRATGASPHKNVTPIKTGKNIIMKSPNKTEEQSLNSSFIFLDELEPLDMSPSNNCMKRQDLSNKFDKNEKISPKSRKSLKKNELIRLNNIKPCRVVVDKLPENLDGIKNLAMGKSCAQGKKIENSHPKLKQNNSVELESKLLNCSTIEKSSPVDLVVDPESSVCSEKKLDFLQVPFSDVEVDKNSLEPGRKDTYNFSMTVGQSPIDLKLSVRLDRIDQSVFSKINRSQGTFKIDNLDGSFGDDIETSSSSDDDVGIAFSGKFMKSKDSASNSDGKISHNSLQVSTPRPRYKPLKVKILKSPPKKTKSVPKCWVIVKKLDLCTVKGSSSNTVPSSLGCLGDSKNPNPVNDAASSHGALSGSDDSDIFGEIFSQRETKKETKLEVECNKEACVGLESSASKIVSDTSQKAELNLDIVGICSGRVVGESIKDQLLDDCENNNSSGEEKISLCRVASPIEPVILDGKTENAMKQNNIAIPGPSTSYAQPWSNANVYETCSSSENEDNGVLSFYNMSVYIPGNDSNSDKSATYEIHSQIDECSNFSSEEQKVYIPKIKPPTQNEILSSLSKCGLSKVLNTEPFCSDLSDRTSTEVGPVSLKLKSRTAIDLEEYDGPFSKGICMYRNNLLKSLRVKRSSVLASDRSVVLFPLKRPPTCTEVRKWLKVKSTIERESRNVVEDEKCEKLERLIVPCSPGQNYSLDDEENTLILTPMTPPCRSHSTPSDCPPNGSLSATETPVCTPVPFAQTRCAKRKSSNIIEKSSAKLLKDFAALSSIKENDEDYVLCEKDDKNVQLSESSICISNETREKMEAQLKKKARLSSSFQIETCNSDSTSGLPTRVENLQKTRSQIQHQFLTLMILELHVQTRGDLLPDPENDPIRAIFYHIVNDVPEHAEDVTALTGIIAVGNLVPEDDKVLVTCATDEMSLLSALVELIRKWDPDMFIGYEIEKLSWGYLIERAYTLGMNLNIELSRVIGVEGSSKYEDEQGMLGGDSEQLDIRLAGRIVLNIWRLLRHEVALQSYTFENIMYHVLRRRIPLFSFRSLSAWWEHRTKLYRWMTVEHYLVRVRGIAEILDHLDLIGRTSELARLFGIQFYEVLSRGSQFRVESMMLRMAKPENYVAVSPTTKQRAHMRAPESLPLIMEPESRFYSDPVIVLDFQSLYPSIIIAYNYCFSTCLGRVNNLAKSEFFDFGCTHLRVPFSTVKKLEENLTFSPCGVAFVDSSVRRGVLPRMLQEILETRLMVKRSMKKNKNNKALHKVLHNRQLGLKLIANVTYGYTSANFSGRMPCIEIGDSVVSKGRETLERAIALVNKTEKWGARVVYGDTDSLFVLVAGRSRAEAFQIGAEIAEAVTAENPKPVKLKLEKVYQPCILQTKKRYVGHMWESPDQETPTYDAKGIETVRRDGCPAVAKILQKSLQLLFETKDVSIVKRFILHQFGKVSSGRISIQELTFAREYRGARGYKPGACVPALELARSWMKKDRRSEPRVGERVPYVVVSGPPGLPLIRLVRSPRTVLADPALKINADYYITRVIIPPLNRCLLLVGANAHNWFNSMPRRQPPSLPSAVTSGIKKATISQYFATVSCAVCHDQTTTGLCNNCRARPQSVAVSLATQLHSWERRRQLVLKVCQSCCGRTNNIDCVSLDCPVLYSRADVERDLAHEPVYRQLQHTYFNCDF